MRQYACACNRQGSQTVALLPLYWRMISVLVIAVSVSTVSAARPVVIRGNWDSSSADVLTNIAASFSPRDTKVRQPLSIARDDHATIGSCSHKEPHSMS